jgi:outer membrane usher protein
MFPDGMRSYAPEIRGVAQSNALVTVRQGSNIIYQTTVPPGRLPCRMSILPATVAT